MSDAVFRKAAPLYDVTAVDNIFISEYMPQAPAEYVKAYLFGLMQSTCESAGAFDIGSTLGMSETELFAAFRYWEKMGLVRVATSDPLTVEYMRVWQERPEMWNSPATEKYAGLVESLSLAVGTRILTANELRTIIDWVEIYGFEEAAAVMCVRHCIDLKGARVSVKYMDAVAREWADSKKLSVLDIESYLMEYEQRSGGAKAILKRWHSNRLPSDDEIALYKKWTDEWGFDETAISQACGDLTTVGVPSFSALDRILETYRLNGALSAEDANEYRRKRDMLRELAREMFERAGIKRTAKLNELEIVEEYFDKKHMSSELMLYVAESVRDEAKPFAAMKKRLADLYDNGVATVEAAKARIAADTGAKERKHATAYTGGRYSMRKYGNDVFKNIGVKLIDDEGEPENDKR